MVRDFASCTIAAAAGFAFLGVIAAIMIRDTLKEIDIGPFN